MLNHAEVGIRYLKIVALRYSGVFPLHLSCDATAGPHLRSGDLLEIVASRHLVSWNDLR
jgi:hypothetical protein